MKITGTVRKESDFQLECHATRQASATFIALAEGNATLSRRLADLFSMPDETPVIANWHGQQRTDAFATTVGHLKGLSESYIDP